MQARKGDKRAREALRGPKFPVAVEYLRRWAYELHGRSGFTMDGAAPLSYETITHWAKWTRRHPEPWEIDVLLDLDATLRSEPARIREQQRKKREADTDD